jgi:hypothetical protein
MQEFNKPTQAILAIVNFVYLPGKAAAFLWHLGVSASVIAAYAAWLYWVAYPGVFFWRDGGWQILRIVAVVDLVLGPMLTMMLFVNGKKGLWLDMLFIIAVQLGALAYGVVTAYREQPAVVAFVGEQFYAVSLKELRAHNASNEVAKWGRHWMNAPQVVIVKLPTSADEKKRELTRTLRGESPMYVDAKGYRIVSTSNFHNLMAAGINIRGELEADVHLRKQVQDLVEKTNVSQTSLLIIPVSMRYGTSAIVFDSRTRHHLGWLQ